MLVAEACGEFDQRLVDDDSQRVQVGGVGFGPEPLRFQWYGTTTGERVEHRWHHAIVGVEDCLLGGLVQVLVVDVLPLGQPFHESIESVAFDGLVVFRGEFVGMRRRVVNQLGEQDAP